MTRPSISRLADCAPVASPESWIARKVPGTSWTEVRHPYIADTPWPARKVPGVSAVNSAIPCHLGVQCNWPACSPDCDGRPGRLRPPYINDTPVMLRVHAALEAETRATARAVIKMRARAYVLRPGDLDALCKGFCGLWPGSLVDVLKHMKAHPQRYFGFGGEVLAINLRGAMLYARYSRAKKRQIARRTALKAAIDAAEELTEEDKTTLDYAACFGPGHTID
jgi:hypothetical protein